MEKLIVSTSPHIHAKQTTRQIMGDMVIALMPSSLMAVYYFGIKALLMILVSVSVAVLSEFLFNLCTKKKQTVGDLSAVVTGLLLALNLSAKVELWQVAVGAVFAIVAVKCIFGGIGCNFANPAITARIFMLVAFGQAAGGALPQKSFLADTVAGATPLEIIKNGGSDVPTLLQMFLGDRGGAIGETCIVALLLGFVYLLIKKVITFEVPVIFIGGVFLFSLLLKQDVQFALYQILGGGLFIGAIFMATDYSTTPLQRRGKAVFALGCAILTVLIRNYGSYPEGVSFAILFMNILSPYIEKLCKKKPLGGKKHEKK